MAARRIRNRVAGISHFFNSTRMMMAGNSLLLLAVIVRLSTHDLMSALQVSAYSPQPGVWIASHPRAHLSGRRIPSTQITDFSQHSMSSSVGRTRWGIDLQDPTHSTSTSLYHMGHSHSHHDHHHHHHHHSTATESKPFSKKQLLRRLALVLFCWMSTCGMKLVQTATNVNGAKRFVGLSRSDWISFVVTSVALTSANKIMGAVQQSVENVRKFVDGIRKHSSTTEVQDEFDEYQNAEVSADKADADRVTWIGVAVNLLLSVGKLGVGITAHSSVLVADAGHSLSDLVSDFITLWSVNVARLPPDEDHPYGHYKFEAIGSLFLSLTLLATGGSVGLMANKQLMEVLHATATSSAVATVPMQIPGTLALVMAGLSILSKEWLFRITKQVGERLRSPVVIANAWHHRSDAYSSILALFSIAWAMIGFPAADAAAGILVAGMICMTGGEILVESVKQLSDSADSDLQAEIVEILNELDDDDVIAITSVRARQMGSAVSVDVTVEIPSVLSTTASSAVEERIRKRLHGELSRRRGGRRNDASSSGIMVVVHAKPYLEISPLMEDFDYGYDESLFAKLAFEKFDTDVDGKLTIDELKAGLEKTLNIQLSRNRVRRLLEEFDVNNDGYLELEEMVTIDQFRSKIEALSREEMDLINHTNLLDDMPSTTYIEQQVRNQAQLMHPKIRSVEGVTVHYTSHHTVTVDVNIRITEDSGSNALGKVRKYARELKHKLETELHQIESARVYLDLNANDEDDEQILLSQSASNMTNVPSSLAP